MKKEVKKAVKKEVKKKVQIAGKHAAATAKKPVKKELKPKKAPKIETKAPVIVERHVAQPKVETVHLVEEKKAEFRPKPVQKRPAKQVQYHGTGGRKTSSARVWMTPGTGKFMINGRTMEVHSSGRKVLSGMALQPFVATNTSGKFDIVANVVGGGYVSQIGAVRQAVSQAISAANPELRPILRKQGLLTRDPREKERKKYGQKRARKRFQYSKR